MFASHGASSSKRNTSQKWKKTPKKRADPRGSSLSITETLAMLRQWFEILEEVELIVPSPSDRLDKPPPNHLSLYKSFFYVSLLWFPIPALIIRFQKKHRLALSQIMPRGMCHLVGILVLSYEYDVEVWVHDL